MSVNFTGPGVPFDKETTTLVARRRDFVAGEFGLVHGIPGQGVDLSARGGALSGPQGSVVPNGDEGIALRSHGALVIAKEDIDQDAAGYWQLIGPVKALVKFPSAGTFKPQAPLVYPDATNDCVLQQANAPGTKRVKARLAHQVVVTDATQPMMVEIDLAGRSGF